MSSDLLSQIEFLLGSVGVTLAFFFAAFLLITRNQQPKANLFLAIYLLVFALRIGKSLFHEDFVIPEMIRTYILSTMYLIGPSLWLYSSHLNKSAKDHINKDWIHFIPFAFLLCVCWAIPNDGTSRIFVWFYNGAVCSMLGYTLYALYWISTDKAENGRDQVIRPWLRYFLTANILLFIFYFLNSIGVIPFYQGISIGFSLLIVVSAVIALRFPKLFKVDKEKYLNSNITKDKTEALAERLIGIMKNEQPYLDPEMNLKKLGTLSGCSSKELSQVINQKFQKNYAQYIAEYRLEETKRRLVDQQYEHLSIAAIAYDSGFNSISSFNSQFKKYVGTTAKAYREQNHS